MSHGLTGLVIYSLLSMWLRAINYSVGRKINDCSGMDIEEGGKYERYKIILRINFVLKTRRHLSRSLHHNLQLNCLHTTRTTFAWTFLFYLNLILHQSEGQRPISWTTCTIPPIHASLHYWFWIFTKQFRT